MKNKEPGLLRQIIAIHYEQAKRRKALRTLAKAEWTWEFLESVVTHAADMQKKDIEIVPVETAEDVLREALGISLPRFDYVLASLPEVKALGYKNPR